MWGLGVFVPLLGAGALWVIQDPSEVRVAAGEGVALGCLVVATEPPQMFRVEWLKGAGQGVLCSARMGPAATPAPCVPGLSIAWDPPIAALSIQRARPGDAGCYVCRVTLEIPHLATATGNGTVLTVSAAAAAEAGHGAGLAGGLAGALGGTFLLFVLAFLGHRHWRRRADTATYMNVLPRSERTPKERLPPPGR